VTAALVAAGLAVVVGALVDADSDPERACRLIGPG
jgi:hypothetical protein